MHITFESDYAIRIVDCLARNDGRMGAKSISELSYVTLRFSLKILRKLVSSGIVRSYKGSQGGYELARPACEITIADILDTIEGPYYLNRCLRKDHICNNVKNGDICPYRDLFAQISGQVQTQLKSVTIAQIVEGHYADLVSSR